ncbi:uncharacterized protein LOC126755996 [Bactrocera neohumeralis]|uniref:uncharacterized protein LOC126755996 n=1 Tax=Bactrocera neohumeralis TaxID=98809 RepID=UPI00216577F2|nr:uncharacterized protein LOC126755996 [Bactrocera neohumeralis]
MYLKSAVKLLPSNNQYLKTDIPLNDILSTGRKSLKGLLGLAQFAKRYPILGAIVGGLLALIGIIMCLRKVHCCDEPEKEQTNAVVQQGATYPRQYADCDEPEKEQTNAVVQQDADPEAQNLNTESN